jgi:hypothetical protein
MLTILRSLIEHIPNITIPKPDGNPYLTRYYLLLKDRELGNLFLHHFRSSDLDTDPNDGVGGKTYLLHHHPAKWAFSFVLTQGYWEERRNPDDTITRRFVKPLSFNFFTHNDFHRVELIDENNGPWTLFFTGSRKNNSWGFWNRITKQYKDYKQFSKAIL